MIGDHLVHHFSSLKYELIACIYNILRFIKGGHINVL